MLLIPAIDLKDGQVRSLETRRHASQSTVFGEDPAAIARSWLDKPARAALHLVDFNGAFAGKPKNEQAIQAPFCKEVGDRGGRCNSAVASAISTPLSVISMPACAT
jgi:phosphoribosylformimino-5-aminoimidazole carboxamide ribotide isomerase